MRVSGSVEGGKLEEQRAVNSLEEDQLGSVARAFYIAYILD
jgi:hypothetical protein